MSLGSYRWLKLLICSVIFTASNTYANENILLRKTFLNAEKQVWNAKSASYQNLYQQLHYYPLQPYLDQKRLLSNIRLSSTKEIALFLAEYEGSPLDWPLRKKWLTYLAKKNKMVLFQRFFKPTSNVELTCQFYLFQLKSGKPAKQVLPKVNSLWVVGKSQPKVCDPLFKQWKASGYLTKEIVWKRIALAADGGKHTLIPYLTTLLPENEKYLATLWHKVRRDPGNVSRLSKFKHKSERAAEIVTYGLKRLIWRSPQKALDTYEIAKNLLPFTPKQQQQIVLKFALALASKNHEAANDWLSKVESENFSSNLTQWYITEALRDQNWQNIKAKLEKLPLASQQKLQWQYWYGRSLIGAGEQENGRALLSKLSLSRHYYGFLAASYLDKPIQFQDKPLIITAEERTSIIKEPAAKRAFELFAIGRYHQARKEWNFWLSKLNQREKLVASKLANEMQWYDRAIFTLANVGYLDDVSLRFPLGFEDHITQYANKQKINPAWAFAIARRESSFMSDANSSAGAKGLMQIMPGTAKQLSRKRKLSKQYLFNAKNNIRLGTQYLRRLLDRHKGNQILATAAYNAGPHRVKTWLKDAEPMPADIWIETIPFKETREYVKSVLAYQQIYQYKVGKPMALFDQITEMNISN